LARQELVYVDFGLKLDESGAISLWAANLGTSSFVVGGVDVRTQERSTPQRRLVNVVVPSGKLKSKIPFDDRIFWHAALGCVRAFRHFVEVQGFGGKPPDALEGFTVERRARRQLDEGFTGLWGLHVPNARVSILWA